MIAPATASEDRVTQTDPVLLSATDPGEQVNDDCWVSTGPGPEGLVAVVDGATGVADHPYVPGADSDAAWFARTVGAALLETGDGPLAERARAAYAAGFAAFDRVAPAGVPLYARPLASLAAVHWQRRGERLVLEAVVVGDPIIAVQAPDHPPRLLARSPDVGDSVANAKVKALHAEGVIGAKRVWAALLDWHRTAREPTVRRWTAWAAGDGAALGKYLTVDHADVGLPAELLLASDGLYRLVDHYGVHDDAGFIAAAVADLPGSLARLRAIEADDADCVRVPRIKPRDDATGVVLRFGV